MTNCEICNKSQKDSDTHYGNASALGAASGSPLCRDCDRKASALIRERHARLELEKAIVAVQAAVVLIGSEGPEERLRVSEARWARRVLEGLRR